jgi:WD40 repeat protein
MVDMNALERQLADESLRIVGPEPVVDDAAIFTAITATQSPKWRFQSMFSATKFVVAGAIVALFGGFLMAGVLTQPSDEPVPAAGASASASTQVEPTMEATKEPEPAPENTETGQADSTARPGTFTPVQSLTGAPVGTATLLKDGRVLIVGEGASGVWDPETGSFSPAGETIPRTAHSAVLLPDGRVLIVGGYGSEEDLYQAEVWDPVTESFSPAGSLIEWRSGWSSSTTRLPDGRGFVVGGGDDHRRGASALAEVWDPETATFSSAGEMAKARVSQTATVLPDGRVLVVGGMVPNDLEKSAASAEIWDPVTASFSPAGSLFEGRDGHTATLHSEGRVLVIGGDPGLNDCTRSAEVWDPVTASFSPAGSLLEERYKHTATLLPDGRVLVIGGNGGDPSTAEVWDPATASFSPVGSLAEAGPVSSATLLPDGRVLVIGLNATAGVWEPSDR